MSENKNGTLVSTFSQESRLTEEIRNSINDASKKSQLSFSDKQKIRKSFKRVEEVSFNKLIKSFQETPE